MSKRRNEILHSEGRYFRYFRVFNECLGWIQIVASPFLMGLIIGAIIYYSNQTTVRLCVGVIIATTGLIIGMFWATKYYKGGGTISFISKNFLNGNH